MLETKQRNTDLKQKIFNLDGCVIKEILDDKYGTAPSIHELLRMH